MSTEFTQEQKEILKKHCTQVMGLITVNWDTSLATYQNNYEIVEEILYEELTKMIAQL